MEWVLSYHNFYYQSSCDVGIHHKERHTPQTVGTNLAIQIMHQVHWPSWEYLYELICYGTRRPKIVMTIIINPDYSFNTSEMTVLPTLSIWLKKWFFVNCHFPSLSLHIDSSYSVKNQTLGITGDFTSYHCFLIFGEHYPHWNPTCWNHLHQYFFMYSTISSTHKCDHCLFTTALVGSLPKYLGRIVGYSWQWTACLDMPKY